MCGVRVTRKIEISDVLPSYYNNNNMTCVQYARLCCRRRRRGMRISAFRLNVTAVYL